MENQLPEQKQQESAEHLTIAAEQLSMLNIEEKLTQVEEEFRRSAEYIMQKNDDLYRRLS